jgi:signal peptide peptidase SppA
MRDGHYGFWAIDPDRVPALLTEFRTAMRTFARNDAAAREVFAASQLSRRQAVAVIPVQGPIMRRYSVMAAMGGVASIDRIRGDLRAALADTSVDAILLSIDSPGGTVAGVDDLAREIRAGRAQKPIVALCDNLAASAAYYLASQASEIVAPRDAEVGSIGVYAMHADCSGAMEEAGLKISFVSAGKYKVEGNPFEPLSDEGRASIQSRVDDYYGLFLDAVAEGRGVRRSKVENGFGQGRVVGAVQALEAGMIDRIGTFDDAVLRAGRKASRMRAAADGFIAAAAPYDDGDWPTAETMSQRDVDAVMDECMPPPVDEAARKIGREYDLARRKRRARANANL